MRLPIAAQTNNSDATLRKSRLACFAEHPDLAVMLLGIVQSRYDAVKASNFWIELPTMIAS